MSKKKNKKQEYYPIALLNNVHKSLNKCGVKTMPTVDDLDIFWHKHTLKDEQKSFNDVLNNPRIANFIDGIRLAGIANNRSKEETIRVTGGILLLEYITGLWNKNKQTYIIDDELRKEFVNCKDIKFVKDSLFTLPFTTFCLETKNEYGTKYYLVNVENKHFNEDDNDEFFVTTLIENEGTVNYKQAVLRFRNATFTHTVENEDAALIANSLNYLVSDIPDIEDVYARQKMYKVNKDPSKTIVYPPNIVHKYEVGFRDGAAIRKYYKQLLTDQHNETRNHKSGYHVRPHYRRAHWETRWVGPRNDPSKRKLKAVWINALMVNVDRDTQGCIRGDIVAHKVS